MINELVKMSYSKRERIVSGKRTFIKVFGTVERIV